MPGTKNKQLGKGNNYREIGGKFGGVAPAAYRKSKYNRGTKRLVSVDICSVEGNSAGIFVSKVSPGIFVIKER